jgi:hypothetical protein
MVRKKQPQKDHPEQAIDTDLPGDDVNEEGFKALQELYEPVEEDK